MATRNTYRHGNLRHALIAAGVELAREGGPDAVVLREATRRVGVAPNAAYRHFADRRALLAAVSQAGLAELARTMERELVTGSPARARLRALTRGYLAFAQSEPGLFRAAFATTGMADTDTEEAAGAEGRTAYRLLSEALDDLAASGALPPEHRPDAEYFVWSTVHGMAVLLTDGPLRGLRPPEAEEAERRVMDAVERGLCGTSG
ncbi:TetR/AcrR family transcriptional regulator [Streptomyces coelicoflavus]|uniref:TetR/AcrR family transcriptional regulator n=1 Tax=Streptomyces TaxID=1883 RepID=UPI000247752C|nr:MULTISPECIES: TetR/AcrR family transcriptional regulator [Streptomyces]EHN73450.1 TetR family transcriptional regulator [Streptomyces coelicoflavus ZG0656]MZE42306.1 TetR family transcriptional regulator [Streptomyces sp. SID5477]OWA07706.1 TetR family transcriptional regulator [Streptomyces sp. CS159]